MSRLNYQRQAKLQQQAKALKAADAARQAKSLGSILKKWEPLDKATGEAGIGFFLWAGKVVGFLRLFQAFETAKKRKLDGQYAFDFVKHEVYSRLRETT